MYFKAELLLSTEMLWLNPKTQEYEGTDFETYQDHGPVDTITANTLRDLRDKIEKRLSFFKNMELIEDDDDQAHFEYQCDGEYEYRTPEAERIPFVETWSIYVTQVSEEGLGAKLLKEII